MADIFEASQAIEFGKKTSASYGVVNVGDTATSILSSFSGRKLYTVQNTGPDDLYLGFDGSVTTTSFAYKIPSGKGLSDGIYTGDVYGITVTAGSADVAYTEL